MLLYSFVQFCNWHTNKKLFFLPGTILSLCYVSCKLSAFSSYDFFHLQTNCSKDQVINETSIQSDYWYEWLPKIYLFRSIFKIIHEIFNIRTLFCLSQQFFFPSQSQLLLFCYLILIHACRCKPWGTVNTSIILKCSTTQCQESILSIEQRYIGSATSMIQHRFNSKPDGLRSLKT